VNLNTALIGAATGFATFFLADLKKWSESKRKFNWKIAAKRWTYGAATGLLAALGISQSGVQL